MGEQDANMGNKRTNYGIRLAVSITESVTEKRDKYQFSVCPKGTENGKYVVSSIQSSVRNVQSFNKISSSTNNISNNLKIIYPMLKNTKMKRIFKSWGIQHMLCSHKPATEFSTEVLGDKCQRGKSGISNLCTC